MKEFLLLIILFFSCTRQNSKYDQEYNNLQKNVVRLDNPLLYMGFEEKEELPKVFNDIACDVYVDSNASDYSYLGKGILVTSVQNTKTSIVTKAYVSFKGQEYFEDEKWFTFSFLVPQMHKVDSVNYGRDIVLFSIFDNKEKGKDNILSFELNVKKNDIYIGMRTGKNRYLACVSKIEKGKWNNVLFKANFRNDKYGYVEAWLNNEEFTPLNGYGHRFYGFMVQEENQGMELTIGQRRNWFDTNPSLIYFDELVIGRTLDDVYSGPINYPSKLREEFSPYK